MAELKVQEYKDQVFKTMMLTNEQLLKMSYAELLTALSKLNVPREHRVVVSFDHETARPKVETKAVPITATQPDDMCARCLNKQMFELGFKAPCKMCDKMKESVTHLQCGACSIKHNICKFCRHMID